MAESAVKFLLEQLSVLLRDEHKLLGGLETEVQSIEAELRQLREFLRVADNNEDSNIGLKEWVGQLREISYDVEDILDKYMLRFGRSQFTTGFNGCIRRAYASVKNVKARRQIASEIQAITKRLQILSTSQQRYRDMYAFIDQGSSSAIRNNEAYDGRGDALFLEDDDVVGIEKPKKQLLEWVGSVDDGLEVISVVGMGGLGKTTLVKKVYDDESMNRGFTSHVWIVASEYTNVKHLLANLVKKLVAEIQKSPPQDLEDMSLDDMRNFIKEFLKVKNYIIVLDDVWTISTWEALKSALPKRGVHGCVIITTRSSNIADASCSETNHVYNLQPLTTEESKVLFYRKAFPRSSCPPYITEFVENILKRCEGLPLAIVVIGGLLATNKKNAEEWEVFNRSLGQELEGGGRLEILGKILSLSYRDLSYYLKYCYLYLSIFPEDALLEKETIIRLWIAEGFVQRKQDKSMEEVAADYLNQLLSRSLIQVAKRRFDGRVRAFRIHDLLRDFIITKSREFNMITIYGGGEMQWPGKIRRFAIQNSFSFSGGTYNFEWLRSLLLCFGNLEISMINDLLRRCRLLKVLDLRGAPLEIIPSEVFKLCRLKYLCLRDTMIKLIPKSIKYLWKLETLDLKNTNVTELPIEILKLRHLRYLVVYKYDKKVDGSFRTTQSFKGPCDIGSFFPYMLKLMCIDAIEIDGIKIVREIGKLTQLRKLGIAKLRSEDGKELCCSIAKLTNLRSLIIQAIEEGERLDLDYPLKLPFLRTLELSGYLEKIPQWIPSLNALTTLSLRWNRMREDPLNCLQDLPNLSYLWIDGADVEELCFKAQGFQKLKELVLSELKLLKRAIVEKGCMPYLEELYMWDCKMMRELPQGMDCLINLKTVLFDKMADKFVEKSVVLSDKFVEKAVESQRNIGWLARVPRVVIRKV